MADLRTSRPGSEYPVPHFYFELVCDDEAVSFQEVSGIETTSDSIVDPSENSFVHQLPEPVRHENLTLKRGVLHRHAKLLDWFTSAQVAHFQDRLEPRTITVRLLDPRGASAVVWTVLQAYPVRCQVGRSNAHSDDIAIESIEFAYQQIVKSTA